MRNLGLLNPTVSSRTNIGALTGENRGAIIASYAEGGPVTIGAQAATPIGGIIGNNASTGAITASYARVSVSGNAGAGQCFAGGLVGKLTSGSVIASYGAGTTTCTTTGTVDHHPDYGQSPLWLASINSAFVGGLAGVLYTREATVTNSYCDNQAAGLTTACIRMGFDSTIGNGGTFRGDFTKPPSYPTAQFQTPTTYTGIYQNWNVDLNGDAFPDHPWNFGSTTTYPTPTHPDARTVDHDPDGDNLINVNTLDQLNAIRHDLNGDGLPASTGTYAAYAAAFPGGALVSATPTTPRMGCPSTCTGYELTANLDFAADGSAVTTTDAYPNWNPIGNADGYAATFDGNGRTITRLTITSATGNAGLFDTIGSGGVIRDLGMIDANISNTGTSTYVGVLAGNNNGGEITASYASGGSITITGTSTTAGGLLGRKAGTIRAVYATTTVNAGAAASSTLGGLIGLHTGNLTAAYAAGAVTATGAGALTGGLIGQASSTNAAITNSYCDTQTTGQTNCIGAQTDSASVTADGQTTTELQTPTAYTGIYAHWNLSLDADDYPDNPWNFRAANQYPAPKTPAQRQMVTDYDTNGNNLIEIDSLDQLNAIRHDLNGNGLPAATSSYPAYAGAFPGGDLASTTTRMGCAATCTGYELTANLDFAADGNAVTTTDAYPNWTPIGNAEGYTATFDGQGHTIARLTIDAAPGNAGLFHTLGSTGLIRDVGMLHAAITSAAANAHIGILAGNNHGGTITASYADGGSITGTSTTAGGLLGRNTGAIRAVYATTTVSAGATASSTTGGLIGLHTGALTAAYAAGAVTATSPNAIVGGLIGQASSASAAITNSYCDTQTTGQTNCIGSQTNGATATSTGYTTTQLQTPVGYTGIYQNWNIDLDGVGMPLDDPWNFGTTTDYPTLKTPADRQPSNPPPPPTPDPTPDPGDGDNGNGESGDVPPPALPRTIQPEPEKPYDPAADHPEIYTNTEYEITATCETRNPDPETGNPREATITFNLGNYNGPILLALSIWTGSRYMAYETQNIAEPTLQRNGQTATLSIETNPAQTRFRLDGTRNGLRHNLVLGYADCRTN